MIRLDGKSVAIMKIMLTCNWYSSHTLNTDTAQQHSAKSDIYAQRMSYEDIDLCQAHLRTFYMWWGVLLVAFISGNKDTLSICHASNDGRV